MLKIKIKLKEAMKSRGITQMQLKEMSGVRQAAISELCRNDRVEVNLHMLEKISDALNISDISELLQFEEDKKDSL
ncbi:helix-turn-helix domain-containing protein [Paenibacillus aquistagni]|uniref:Cro/C1-type HTH DNA-binding domain-containing protein n=1 Tax=Paenibacillus aquistagni TaxID=1852522 RepID=A0A1X7LED1_9BACL|nr:helix-turn-helix transcriptional regulator [Paenibacillus aquistagni]SMG52191.1 Cro/C1-type HTH DNA-binding domain-containing protein [Paenibacillus aquistagni]